MFIEEWLYQKLIREEEEYYYYLEEIAKYNNNFILDAVHIPLYRVESVQFIAQNQELLAYDCPITKIITENSVKDLQESIDANYTQFPWLTGL